MSMSKLRARTISIHALREEGDDLPAAERAAGMGFLSTPSARRATSAVSGAWTAVTEFLSTPSARRATLTAEDALGELADFYPRPPRGGRLYRRKSPDLQKMISIHALREEGD